MSLGEGCPPTKDMGSGGITPCKILKLEMQFGAFWRQTHTQTRVIRKPGHRLSHRGYKLTATAKSG